VVRDGETLEVIGAISGGDLRRFPPEMADVLLSPERRAHIDPARALGEFGLRPRSTFADLGCGPGFFTMPAAKIVGPLGKVHAADVQPEMLVRVREAAEANDLSNVETHLVREEPRGRGWHYDFGIAVGKVDLALVAFVLHEAEDPVGFLRAAAALLKPSGRLALLQWQARDTYAGPAVQVRMTPEQTLRAAERAGLRAQEAPPLDPDHYAFFLRRT
jgi:SAM-dependent methyltransferase